MKNRKIIILFSLLLSMGIFTRGTAQEMPEKLVLDLQGAVDHALAFNKSLKNSRSEVERARARNWEAISQGLPQIDGGMDYSSFFNYELEFFVHSSKRSKCISCLAGFRKGHCLAILQDFYFRPCR